MFVPSFYIRPYEILGGLIMNHPFILISIGLLTCIVTWLNLNFSDIHRKACTIPELPIDSMWNREKIEKYKSAVRLQTMVNFSDGFKIAEVDLKLQENVRQNWPFFRDRRIDAFGDITKRALDE